MEKILIIEDNMDIQFLLSNILKRTDIVAISTNKDSYDGLGKRKEESIQSERLAFTGRIAVEIRP